MKKIFFAMSIAAALASCSDDYTDWANPMSNPDEAAKTVQLAVSPAAAIDFATLTDDSVQLFIPTVTAENGAVNSFVATLANDGGETKVLNASGEGKVATDELKTAVEGLFGKRPVARTIALQIVGYTNIDGQAIRNEGTTTATATPVAPEISTLYYITGGINGWDNKNTDYPVANSGADPYDDPHFKITLTAEQVGEGFEFKLTPVEGLGGDWGKCVTAAADGADGHLSDKNAGGNLKITAVPDAKLYNVDFNLLDQTWTVQAVSFGLYIYEVGNNTSWGDGTPVALASPSYDGNYLGFGYLNGEFKFKPNADNWDGDWGQQPGAAAGTLVQDGEENCKVGANGYYAMNVNLVSMTYSLTLINTIGIIGNGGDWNNDIDLTYNEAEGTWEATAELKAGEFKFRANHGWDLNWGGTEAALTQGGANINCPADGTYAIKLWALCDGQAHFTMTRK